jgi:hypothetical protein
MKKFAQRCTTNLEHWEAKQHKMNSSLLMASGPKSSASAAGRQPKRRQGSNSTTSSIATNQPFNNYRFPMALPTQLLPSQESDVCPTDSTASSPRTHASSGSSLNGGVPSDRPMSSFELSDDMSSISSDNHHYYLSHPQPLRPHNQQQPSSAFVIPTIVSPNSTTSSGLSSSSQRSYAFGDDPLSSPASSIPRPSSAASGISIASSTANTVASTSTTAGPADATAAIRAALQKSVRKKSSVRSFHRNSWNPPLPTVPPVPALPVSALHNDQPGGNATVDRVLKAPGLLTTQTSL